jgi:hypothetical protein
MDGLMEALLKTLLGGLAMSLISWLVPILFVAKLGLEGLQRVFASRKP